MAERKRIGLRFSYNENWIAGSYYVLNIISALNSLQDEKKPIIVILSEDVDNFNIVKKETNYPFLEFFKFPFNQPKYSFIERGINKIGKKVLKQKLIDKIPKQPEIDFLYPKYIDEIKVDGLKKVNWIPDFQEEYLPHFFSEEEIKKRKYEQREIFSKGDFVVLSSYDAEKDFLRLYPNAKAKTVVLNFAVTLPDFNYLSLSDLLLKYKLPNHYFFAPNQFWAHKNHIIILKAIKLLKDNGNDVVVAFSGKESDYRNLDNFTTLKTYISKHNLESNIKFLGFIEREEQLCLMKHCIAIIQPSLFEGWSTVVEDAKALNKFIILSNLNVHKEQINDNVHFFNPNNTEELSQIIFQYSLTNPKVIPVNYNTNIKNFAQNFVGLIEQVSRN